MICNFLVLLKFMNFIPELLDQVLIFFRAFLFSLANLIHLAGLTVFMNPLQNKGKLFPGVMTFSAMMANTILLLGDVNVLWLVF